MTNLALVLETDDFIVVNKPVGIGMHGGNVDHIDTIISIAESTLKIKRLWLVHRLDTATSGCIILGKSAESAAALSALFADKKIQKYYLALVSKKPKKKQGKIVGDMQKARNGSWKLVKEYKNPAITQFFSFPYESAYKPQDDEYNSPSRLREKLNGSLRLCMLKPHTGKTHQLRVALKSLGSPIVGDKRYKGCGADRMYLHAYALTFTFKEKLYNIRALPEEGELFNWQSIEHNFAENGQPWEQKWPKI
jgi:tRNA pseudouridine32 synthase/23S rRNA pseudouridine746 synthase